MELHLPGGEVISVCHVIGIAPLWVAIAAREHGDDAGMVTVLVPYELIGCVEIRPAGRDSHRLGFSQHELPTIIASAPTAEQMLKAAADASPARRMRLERDA